MPKHFFFPQDPDHPIKESLIELEVKVSYDHCYNL